MPYEHFSFCRFSLFFCFFTYYLPSQLDHYQLIWVLTTTTNQTYKRIWLHRWFSDADSPDNSVTDDVDSMSSRGAFSTLKQEWLEALVKEFEIDMSSHVELEEEFRGCHGFMLMREEWGFAWRLFHQFGVEEEIASEPSDPINSAMFVDSSRYMEVRMLLVVFVGWFSFHSLGGVWEFKEEFIHWWRWIWCLDYRERRQSQMQL